MIKEQVHLVPRAKPLNTIPLEACTDLKNEPMIFSGDYEFSRKHGGPITRAFLERLPSGWDRHPFILDSRVHMLKPGWMPCIGGWHLDDIPRSGPENQPAFDKVDLRTYHVAAVIGTVSMTEFVDELVSLDLPESGLVYKDFDRQITALKPKTYFVKDRYMFGFGSGDLHRGTPATEDGWRMFIRASIFSPRAPRNEVRRQTQVYVESFKEGW